MIAMMRRIVTVTMCITTAKILPVVTMPSARVPALKNFHINRAAAAAFMTAHMLLQPGKQSKLSVLMQQFILAICFGGTLHTSHITLYALPPTACLVLQVWRRPAACARQSVVHRHSQTLNSSCQPVHQRCPGCSGTFQHFSTSGCASTPDQTAHITAAAAAPEGAAT